MELSRVDQFLIRLIDRGAATGPGKLAVTVGRRTAPHPDHRDLLSPIIGQAKIVDFDVNPIPLRRSPTAFTYKMPSFDGTLISVNFPATNVARGDVSNAPRCWPHRVWPAPPTPTRPPASDSCSRPTSSAA